MFYEVIPTEVFRSGGSVLTYSSDLPLSPGHLVLVPLGRRVVTGIVYRRVKSVDFPTKPITKLLCPLPLPRHLLDSIFWLSEYYLTPIASVASLMLPPGIATKTALNSIPTFPAPSAPPTAIPLNSAQQDALATLRATSSSTRLLRGITGSGKTNLYLTLAADALAAGQSTILLVPEIALTSQLVDVFSRTFPDRIALLHSNQTMTARRRAWLSILYATTTSDDEVTSTAGQISSELMREENEARKRTVLDIPRARTGVFDKAEARDNRPLIVVGPRSALLSPLHNLGLIIIDEAHESAYYQENTPRYSAPRLASFIAHRQKIPCILGSATPNLVDYHLAKTRHSLVSLDTKAKSTARDPRVAVVDLKKRDQFTKNRYFSDPLLTSIEHNLTSHHQTLIFHNRRGSALSTLCEHCGWQALCPNCFLPMTLHADTYRLDCHICGHQQKVPVDCPDCHRPSIIHKGFGTKLLESELARLFPHAAIARFDGDNAKTDDLATLYDDVKDGSVDILIGTQTLARGLDLPHLATVGIVQADAGLSLPDFATEERTFELLTQVIGRVGRGHLDIAEAIIQSYQPDHPVITHALASDYVGFADYLLAKRRTQHMPPFTYLARLSITYKTERTTLTKIRQAYAELSQNSALEVSPPTPAFHERTSRGFTWQLTIKATSRETLRRALAPFATSNSPYSLVLDPPSLL